MERGHEQDVLDVEAMAERSLLSPATIWRYFDAVSDDLFRYPAVSAPSLERAMEVAFGPHPQN